MDPEANLKEQLELARAILKIADCSSLSGAERAVAYGADAERLAELVVALAEWRAKAQQTLAESRVHRQRPVCVNCRRPINGRVYWQGGSHHHPSHKGCLIAIGTA